MNGILNIYKPVGLTPLQLIQKLRKENQKYKDVRVGFAGRLDPLAHGVMLFMLGNETKNRDKYLNLQKEYEFEVLFGMSTDTYDSLGFLNNLTIKQPALPVGRFNSFSNLEKKINKFVKRKHGKHIQAYPPYSSKEVNGKPLFQWAREDKLSEIKIPSKEINISKFEHINITKISTDEIKKIILENIKSVTGDFRQAEILEKWKNLFSANKLKNITVAKFKINCSSGTYVRSLASEMGEEFGLGAIALSILRTKVGKNKLQDSLKL